MIGKKRGVALLTVTGMMVLLAIAAAAFATFSIRLRERIGVQSRGERARLLARSGLEYAAARLRADQRAAPSPTPGNQPDDWAYREKPGLPLEKALNPSYAITEPYQEVEKNGRYDEGVDLFTDVDDNGRFDSWSGRLRFGGNHANATFLLRVGTAEAGVCVNDGSGGLRQEGNHALVDFLNVLGAVVETDDPRPGNTIRDRRPPQGYAGREHLRSVMSPGDWEKIGPFLSLSGAGAIARVDPADAPPGSPDRPPSLLHKSPVSLDTVDRAVLEAMVRGLWIHEEGRNDARAAYEPPSVHHGFTFGVPKPDTSGKPPERYWTLYDEGDRGRGNVELFDPRSPPGVWGYDVSLSTEEGKRLADFLASRRPFPSWHAVYRQVFENRSTLFTSDYQAASQPDPALPRLEMRMSDPRVPGVKVCLALSSIAPEAAATPLRHARFLYGADGYDLGGYDAPFSCPSYDLAGTDADAAGEPRRSRATPLQWRVRRDPTDARYASLDPEDRVRATTGSRGELGVGPARDFWIESLGRIAGRRMGDSLFCAAEGSVRSEKTVALHSQADFENWGGDGRSFWRGERSLGEGVRIVGRPKRERTGTWPQYPLDSCADLQDPERHPVFQYRACWGDIRLMARAEGNWGANFYLPRWEIGQPRRADKEAGSLADLYGNQGTQKEWGKPVSLFPGYPKSAAGCWFTPDTVQYASYGQAKAPC